MITGKLQIDMTTIMLSVEVNFVRSEFRKDRSNDA